jgi:hypothetical protein
MAVTVKKGKKFWQIDLGATGGNYVMDADYKIREVRLTNIGSADYMRFYEAYGDNPVVFQLDYSKAATFFQGNLMTKLGFTWASCSVADPANAILSIELE